MSVLTDNSIDFIYEDLQVRGLKEGNLLHELVDHLCCLLEPDLNKGISFNDAYKSIIDSLEGDVFKQIQHETNLSTNLKFQKMKKLMYISGVIGTLIMFTGIIFKIMHWPGASMAIFVGAISLVLIFLPVFFYVSHKEQVEQKSILFPIVGYLTIALLIIGPLFKIMHWPGAGSLLFFGPLLLAVVFLPIYLFQVFKKAKETKTNFIHIITIVGIGIASMTMLISIRPSNYYVGIANNEFEKNVSVYKMVESENENIYALIVENDSIGTNKVIAEKIINSADEIHSFVSDIKNQIAHEADGRNYMEGKLFKEDKPRVFRNVLNENQRADKLTKMLEDYHGLLLENCNSDIQKQIINDYFELNFLQKSADYKRYRNVVTIDGFLSLSEVDKNVELATYEILKNLK